MFACYHDFKLSVDKFLESMMLVRACTHMTSCWELVNSILALNNHRILCCDADFTSGEFNAKTINVILD